MDILRQLWHDAQTVLRDMSTTQRVAVAFLLITMAAWLTFAAWMGSSPAEVGKRPLPLEVEPADINDVLARLGAKGVTSAEYDFESRRVLVNSDEERKAVIALAEEGLLMGAHQFGFEEMLNNWAFSDTRSKTEEAMRLARANEVSRLVESLDGIKEAQVIYSDDVRTSLFGVAHRKSASVRVRTGLQKPLTDEQANTIIAVVASAKAGLDPKDVVVTDQRGARFHSSAANSLGSIAKQKWDTEFALNEELRRRVEYLTRQFIPNIQFDGDVTAFPSHEVNFNATEIMQKDILPGEVAQSSTMKLSRVSSSRPAEEPGTNPNVRRSANIDNLSSLHIDETREDEKTAERTMQNSIRETATKVSPVVTRVTVAAIIHLPYRLRVDGEGNYIQARDEAGNLLIDPETRSPMWERESVERLPPERIDELKRSIALASGIPFEEIPEKIEVSQVDWTAPVHPPRGAETEFWLYYRKAVDNWPFMATILAFLLIGYFLIYRGLVKPVPTEIDDSLNQEKMSLAMTSEAEEEETGDVEWEELRAKVSAAVQEDPKRAAAQLKRWMRKE